MYLESEDLRPVALSLQRHCSGTSSFAHCFRGYLWLFTSPPLCIAFGRPSRTKIHRSALWRDQVGVDKEKQVGERGAEVRAVDGTVAGRFGRIDIFTPPAVQLDGLFVRYVRKADW